MKKIITNIALAVCAISIICIIYGMVFALKSFPNGGPLPLFPRYCLFAGMSVAFFAIGLASWLRPAAMRKEPAIFIICEKWMTILSGFLIVLIFFFDGLGK